MKFSQKNFENWWFWKMHFFWVGHFEFIFSKKKIFFCFFPLKISQSLLVSKDGSKFWSSQTWQHFLTKTKHFTPECVGQKKIEQKSLQETITFSLFEVFFYFFCYCRLGITGKPTSLARRLGRAVGTREARGTVDARFWQTSSIVSSQGADYANPITKCQ